MAQRGISIRGAYGPWKGYSRVSTGKLEDVARYAGALPELAQQTLDLIRPPQTTNSVAAALLHEFGDPHAGAGKALFVHGQPRRDIAVAAGFRETGARRPR